MAGAILAKELRMTLRRREAFVSALIVYGMVTFFLTLVWAMMTEYTGQRDDLARSLFMAVLALGYFLFCVHGALLGARMVVSEREKRTSQLLRLAPTRAPSILFQKLLAPIFHEWLIFFGLLPILSLIFLLGGISGTEFLYQLANIGVWINTSILLGLFISARSRSSTKAVGATIGFLIQLAAVVPYSHYLFDQLADALRIPSLQFPSLVYLIQASDFLSWCVAPLEPLSPFWMFLSYYPGGGELRVPPPDKWMLLVPSWPSLYSYALHFALQVLFFVLAVRAWNRVPEETEANIELGEIKGPSGLWRWIREGRTRRGLFLMGWLAVCQQEDRATFKKGWLAKLVLAGLLCGAVALVQYLSVRNGVVDGRSVIMIVPLFGVIALLVALGYASNAMRREKQRDTAVMLSVTPYPPQQLVFGKWLYYQALCFGILMIGFWLAGLFNLLFWFQARSWTVSHGWEFAYPAPFFAVYIPLFSLIGMLVGLQTKRRVSLVKVIVFLAVLWGFGGLFITLLLEFDYAEPIAEVLSDLFSTGLPFVAILVAAALLLRRLIQPGGSSPILFYVYAAFALACLMLIGLELVFILPGEREEWDKTLPGRLMILAGPMTRDWENIRLVAKHLAVPLAVAFLLWSWISTRTRPWWNKRMLGEKGVE